MDDKLLYTYGRFKNGIGYIWPPSLPVKQGRHAWRITAMMGEEKAVVEGGASVEITGDSRKIAKDLIDQQGQLIKDLEAQLKDPNVKDKKSTQLEIGMAHSLLANVLYGQGEFALAKQHADLAVDNTFGEKPEVNRTLADLCLASGDIERYIIFSEKSGLEYVSSRHYEKAAQAAVKFRNDLQQAWKWAAEHDRKMKEAGQKPTTQWMFPPLDGEIVH